MAGPVLQNTAAITASGTSVSITASLTSPTTNDYRVMVVHTSDTVSNVPTTVTPPAGWTLWYQSPRGRNTIRTWVFGQIWTGATTTGNLTFSANVFYAILMGRVSGYTLPAGVFGPIVTLPALTFDADTSQDAGSLNCQADSLRLDFWAAFYNAAANSGSTVINVPTGMTGSAITRPAGTQGYVCRIMSEARATSGYTGIRTATMTSSSASAVLSIAFGGWKVLNKATSTTLALTPAVKGTKKVTRSTTTTLSVGDPHVVGGRHSSGSSTTTLGLTSIAKHVFLTRTTMGLTSAVAGTHAGTVVSATTMNTTSNVAGSSVRSPQQTLTELRLTAAVGAHVGGGGAPPSAVDQWIAQYQPSDKPLRMMFQEIRSGTWLNWDVPLIAPEITYTLTGTTLIRARVGPEWYDAVQGIDAWSTWVHVEEGGLIRASGIIQPLSIEGDDLVIEAAGVIGYSMGITFESEFAAIQIDPAEAMRQLWAYLQSPPDARLGVTLDATATPRRLGEPARIDVDRNDDGTIVYKAVTLYKNGDVETPYVRVDEDSVSTSAWSYLQLQGYPIYQDTENNNALVILALPNDLAMATTALPARFVPPTGDETEGHWEVPSYKNVDAKPYELAWWNEVDVGREIENLAQQTPFDYAEQPTWADDRLSVNQHITIGYPRLGTKRFDLRFAEDENILSTVLLRENPGWWASQVIVRGAGEGRLAIRAQAGVTNEKRIRRVTSLTDKTITDLQRAQDYSVQEITRRFANLTITEITIDATHDNAPMGSFALGDDILIQARLPYYGELSLWHRITSFTWRPDTDEVVLQLRRSEQFVYGRIVPDV